MSARKNPYERAVATWFRGQRWKPLPFQTEVWRAMALGRSGLLHSPTGTGKTAAAAFGAFQAFAPRLAGESPRGSDPAPFTLLWVTPMRALAADAALSLSRAFSALSSQVGGGSPAWSVGMRTGDTEARERAAQRRSLPTVLVTTPESLTLMLSWADAGESFASLACIVVDEWHELLGSKRGAQTQLALARLKRWRPQACVWGMSATIGNLDEARDSLLGRDASKGALIAGAFEKEIVVDTLLPDSVERFPWAGRLGLQMLPRVIAEIDRAETSLVFTNTRAQAEIWHERLLAAKPEWADKIAVHHASIDRDRRRAIETALKEGALKSVVATSSLDLGVDFSPVERVIQIGSPKGAARLIQRAGRSGHSPGRPSRVTIAPTHGLELVEGAAARVVVESGVVESRIPPTAPLDVLVQHLLTIALGGGFTPDDLYEEVRSAHCYRDLSAESWRWCLDFVRQGGPTLGAYPDFRRAAPDADGVWRTHDRRLALRHRLNIGTIASDSSVELRLGPAPGGARLGSVEESFVTRLMPGDAFWFSGRLLSFVSMKDGVAFVKNARGGSATVPRWDGGRMPLSTTLADEMLRQFAKAARGVYDSPEMLAARPMLDLQLRWSALPSPDTTLVEALKTRDGWSLFVYPFAGRNAHLGMATLLSWRAAQREAGTFSVAVNDYGFEILSAAERDFASELPSLLDRDNSAATIMDELSQCLNAGGLSRKRFREIARIAGLVVGAYPGSYKSARQLQASSNLFYDVFRRYDPENQLLAQADREALHQELDIDLIESAFARLSTRRLCVKTVEQCSPLSFPLMVEILREKLSTETLAARLERMVAQMESAADRV